MKVFLFLEMRGHHPVLVLVLDARQMSQMITNFTLAYWGHRWCLFFNVDRIACYYDTICNTNKVIATQHFGDGYRHPLLYNSIGC